MTAGTFFRDLKTDWQSDPAIPLLGIYPNQHIISCEKTFYTPMFISAQFIIIALMQLETIVLSDIIQSQNTNSICFLLRMAVKIEYNK